MRNKRCTLLYLLALGLFFVGCTRQYDNLDSGIETPDSWVSMDNADMDSPLIVAENALVEQNWWRNFGDPTLDALIFLAIQNNKTLAIAKTRIEEAWAARVAAWSIFFPQINITADTSSGNQGFLTNGMKVSYEDVNLQANWEIDLFGKNQARLNATNALIQSAEAMRQSVLVTLLADVARNYFDLRNYERQIAITEQNLESQKKTYELTREQFEGGLASNFDVQRAGAQVSTTESLLPTLQIAYVATRNRLNILLGSTPGQYDDLYNTKEELKPLDPHIIIAAPATVLATRPDVRDAERRFAASISQHVAATRELFPSISLLCLYGAQDANLFNTIPTWNVASNLTQPLLNFGRIESEIESTSARETRAYLEYQETVLEALADMENALTNYLFETIRNVSLTQAAEQNRKAMELANQQYTNGYNSLLDVLIVQRNALESESSQAESDAKLRKDLVNIYTAAGGGWAL